MAKANIDKKRAKEKKKKNKDSYSSVQWFFPSEKMPLEGKRVLIELREFLPDRLAVTAGHNHFRCFARRSRTEFGGVCFTICNGNRDISVNRVFRWCYAPIEGMKAR